MRTRIGLMVLSISAMVHNVSSAVDFSPLTDLINATMTVLDTLVTNQSTIVSVVIMFATLGIVGVIVYGFIGKLLSKIGNIGAGGKQ